MNLFPRSDLPFLNILHLATTVGRNSGGFGPTLIELAREQRSLGQRTTIWTLDPPEEVELVTLRCTCKTM
jgi:CHAT domain-containing protein